MTTLVRTRQVPSPQSFTPEEHRRVVQQFNAQIAALQAQVDHFGTMAVATATTVEIAKPLASASATPTSSGSSGGSGSGGGGGPDDDSAYVVLAGTSGGQTVHGGTDPGDALVLRDTSDSEDAITQVFLGRNAFGQEQMIVGGDVDPFVALFGSRLFQFLVESEGNAFNLGALFGVYTAFTADGPGASSQWQTIRARGDLASPVGTEDGDYLMLLGANGYPPAQPAAQLTVRQDGSTGSAVPGALRWAVSTDSNLRNVFALHANGFATFADPILDNCHDVADAGQVHIRNSTAGLIGLIVQGAASQTGNLQEWWQFVQTTLAANANVGDTTLTLTDSTKLPSIGRVVVNGQESYAYTANNTGTGVLTLVGTVTANRTSGLSVRALVVDPYCAITNNGGIRPTHMADASAAVDTLYYSTDQSALTYKDSGSTLFLVPPVGVSVTITTAALTTLGAQGSMTFVNGILTAQTPAT